MGFKPRGRARRRPPTFRESVAIDVAERLINAPEENPDHPMCRAANQLAMAMVDGLLKDVALDKIEDQGYNMSLPYWLRRQEQPHSMFECTECKTKFRGRATARTALSFTSYTTCCIACGHEKLVETFLDGAVLKPHG